MDKVNNLNETTLKDINPDLAYTGYLWMSDSKYPALLNGAEYKSLQLISSNSSNQINFEEITNESNPFIIEGQLYNKDANLSYSIKYVDGQHYVIAYDLGKIPDAWVFDKEKDLKIFISNRIKGVPKLKFRQYWKPETDGLCEGMEVLVPAGYVFVGFENELKVKEEKS